MTEYSAAGTDIQPFTPYRKAGGHRTPKQRQAEALAVLDMKRQGYIDSQIAAAVGISIPTVQKRLTLALELFGEPTAAEYRKVIAQQYDSLYQKLIPEIAQGNLDAIAKGTAILDRKAKLLGVEAPQQAEVTVTVTTPQEANLEAMLAAARAAEQAREDSIVEGEVVDA